MVLSALVDFWRRRKFFIIVGVTLVVLVLGFAHLGPFRKGRSTGGKVHHQEKSISSGKTEEGKGRGGGGGGGVGGRASGVFNKKNNKMPLPLYRQKNRDWKNKDKDLHDKIKNAANALKNSPRMGVRIGGGPILNTPGKNKWKEDFLGDYDDDDDDVDDGEAPLIKDGKKKAGLGKDEEKNPLRKDKKVDDGDKKMFGNDKPKKNKLNDNSGSQEFNKSGSQFGNRQFNRSGNRQFNRSGNQTFNQRGNQQFNQRGNQQFNQRGNQQFNQRGSQQFNQRGNQQFDQRGNQQFNQRGNQQFNQRGNQQPGNQQFNQRGNQQFNQQENQQFNQRGNQQLNQRGNQQFQPGNLQFNQRENQQLNQRGNQQFQPGNLQFNQRGNQQLNQQLNQRDQRGNQQFQPGNQEFNQRGNKPGNDQPGKQPLNDNKMSNQLPDNRKNNQPGGGDGGGGNSQEQLRQNQSGNKRKLLSIDDLYVKSSTPIGEPLISDKTERQEAVVRAFKHGWKAYVDYAWGKDEVKPVSHRGVSSYNLGLTIVDSLDTLWLMGLTDEFNKGKDWVANTMDIGNNKNKVSLFETNIRIVGGLLSAFHLTGDHLFLDKAELLGTRLLPAFDTPSGIPSGLVSLFDGTQKIGSTIRIAEAGSIQLEFRDLSRATGNPAFKEACDRAMDKILSQSDGLVPQMLDSRSGLFSSEMYTVGAGVDSYYEYLLKQWLQSGKTENKFRVAYENSVKGVLNYLVGYTQPSHMAYVGHRYDLSSGPPSPYMDHLSCFYPGMLALGIIHHLMPETRGLAEDLTHTCYYMYNSTKKTGLAPDSFQFNIDARSKEDVKISDEPQNILRPETVESLFYLYRLTKDKRYQDWGWKIFQALEKYAKIEPSGYSSLTSVYIPESYRDHMESFFLGETLKYLYLLFGEDDSVFSFNEWVFNTEAHPLPIWKTL